MAYARADIARRVKTLLEDRPGRSLQSIAEDMRIERHTICRCLRETYDCTFSELKTRVSSSVFETLAVNGRLTSWKELAAQLGCSVKTMERWRAGARRPGREA